MQAGRGEQLPLAADSSATGACSVAFKYQPHTQTTLWQYERFPWWQNAGHDLCKCNQSTGIGMWDRFNFFSGGSSVVQAIQRVLHWQTTCYLCQDSSAYGNPLQPHHLLPASSEITGDWDGGHINTWHACPGSWTDAPVPYVWSS